jgi:hypothetical protein
MKEIEISRRNMIALAGTGVAAAALSSCTKTNGSDREDPASENFGDDPQAKSGADQVPFNPEFMSLVHLTSDGSWAISSNDAHFKFTQASYDPAARTKRASEIFLNKIKNGWQRFREAPRGSPFEVYDRTPSAPTPDYADELQFAKFGFGSPHDIYILFEHAPGEISLNPARLIEFSRTLLVGKPANQNFAFSDTELVTDRKLLGDLADLGSLIRLNNNYTIKEGGKFQRLPFGNVTSQEYKLNIFYKTKSGIAMAVDPDTGNGQGHEP